MLVGVGAVDDSNRLITALQNSLPRLVGQCDLMLEEVGRSEGIVAENWVEDLATATTIGSLPDSDILRESSKWLRLPTLGFSMKNWARSSQRALREIS